MAGLAATRTRAMGYLNGTKSEIIMAVDAFKGVAQSQIDAIDGDPSDIQSLIPVLVGAIGGVKLNGIFDLPRSSQSVQHSLPISQIPPHKPLSKRKVER